VVSPKSRFYELHSPGYRPEFRFPNALFLKINRSDELAESTTEEFARFKAEKKAPRRSKHIYVVEDQ